METLYPNTTHGKLLGLVHEIVALENGVSLSIDSKMKVQGWEADERIFGEPIGLPEVSLQKSERQGDFEVVWAQISIDNGDTIMDILATDASRFNFDNDPFVEPFTSSFERALQIHTHTFCVQALAERLAGIPAAATPLANRRAAKTGEVLSA